MKLSQPFSCATRVCPATCAELWLVRCQQLGSMRHRHPPASSEQCGHPQLIETRLLSSRPFFLHHRTPTENMDSLLLPEVFLVFIIDLADIVTELKLATY